MQKTKSIHRPLQLKALLPFRKSRRRKKRKSYDNFSHPLLTLHQNIGNQAIGRLLQTKQKLSQPGDKSELEAERVAEKVMRMSDNPLQPQSEEEEVIQKQSAEEEEEVQRQPQEREEERLQQQTNEEEQDELQRQAEEGEENTVSPKRKAGSKPVITPKVSRNIEQMRGRGEPLPRAERSFFEPRFDFDFSGVRIHKDTRAAETARDLRARAFTLGREVVFRSGEYAPGTIRGRKLLSHELAHVVQQSGIGSFSTQIHNMKLSTYSRFAIKPSKKVQRIQRTRETPFPPPPCRNFRWKPLSRRRYRSKQDRAKYINDPFFPGIDVVIREDLNFGKHTTVTMTAQNVFRVEYDMNVQETPNVRAIGGRITSQAASQTGIRFDIDLNAGRLPFRGWRIFIVQRSLMSNLCFNTVIGHGSRQFS